MALNKKNKNTVITASNGWVTIGFSDIWTYRYLLGNLVSRDIKTQYRQTILGMGWAVIGPLANMVVFTFIFGGLAKMPSEGIPYPLFSFAALVVWTYFSSCTARTTNTLVENSQLISKVYFPRLILLMSPLISSLLSFFISFTVLLLMMAYYGFYPAWQTILLIPIMLIVSAMTSFCLGLLFAPLNVLFRDIAQALPFFIQILMYATPIVYPLNIVPEPYQSIIELNPLTHVVNAFRWALVGTDTFPDLIMFATSMTILLITTIVGLLWFRRMEKFFADVI